MSLFDYKPNAEEVMARLRSLYERQAGDRIFAVMDVPSAAIERFKQQYPHHECEYPDPVARAEFWDTFFAERVALEDDSMPRAYLSEFDQGLYGGLLGGEVRFMVHPDIGWISSMVPPLLSDWSEYDALKFDESHPWWQRYLKQMEIFAEASAGKWGISHFILIDALNFVFELIGATDTYLSTDENPEMVRKAIDFAFDLNVKVHETFFDTVGTFQGGTLSNFGQWIPGRIVSESLDPYHMASVAFFEQWGREPAERIIEHFDGGVVHIHGNGRHLLETAATIKGLKAILLLDDLGIPLAFDELPKFKTKTGGVPLTLFAEYNAFVERLENHDLPGGVIYEVKNVPSINVANRLMEKVRSYRA